MDRRQYIATFGAFLSFGCLSNDGAPGPQLGDSSKDGTPTQAPSESSNETPVEADPSGESHSPTDSGLWEYEFPDGPSSVAVNDAVYAASSTTLTRISPTGDIQWHIGADSDTYAVAEAYDLAVAGNTGTTRRVPRRKPVK